MVVLETDRLRKVLVPKPKYTRGEHSRVFKVCHLLIEEYLSQGRRVMFDATNLTENAREPLYQIAGTLRCPLVLLGFTAPRELVKRRLVQRVPGQHQGDFSDATWQIHCRMRPFEEAIARPHIMVDTSQDISPALDHVVGMISNPDDY
jgi:predicted kinase